MHPMFYKYQNTQRFLYEDVPVKYIIQLIRLTYLTKTDTQSKSPLHLQCHCPDAHHGGEV